MKLAKYSADADEWRSVWSGEEEQGLNNVRRNAVDGDTTSHT